MLRFSPLAITKNQEYDRQTRKVIKRVFREDTIALDIGCHKGEILDIYLKYAPQGQYYAFEPIPDLYRLLKAKYLKSPNCHIFDVALADNKGTADFNLVLDDMAFSGLKKREYKKSFESQTITVKTDRLDALLPANTNVNFIKIDVEGGEMQVLYGSFETLKRCKPFIVFEHGLGASEYYGTRPEQVYDFLSSCGLKISTMKRWLKGSPDLTRSEFITQYDRRLNYYFLAYPDSVKSI